MDSATPPGFSAVLAKCKDYELLTVKHDPDYDRIVASIDVVKKFIIDKNLIVYGGTAIDYALRLRGDKIYSDESLAIPDLDFFSPDNVGHAYELADIFYKMGFPEARAINAIHIRTMKVDIGDNHFVADISYKPPDVFARIPTLKYAGMRIVHPHYQRIDLHSALAFPYDNPPGEVIFQRWSKDISRFNKMAKHYPVEQAQAPSRVQVRVPAQWKRQVLAGYAGYAAMYTWYRDAMKGMGKLVDASIPPASFLVDESAIIFDAPEVRLEIVHHTPEKILETLTGVLHYEPIAGTLPELWTGKTPECAVTVYSTHHRLVSAVSMEVGGSGESTHIRVVGVQYLLRHFMSAHMSSGKNAYLAYYNGLLSMIQSYDAAIGGTLDPLGSAIKSPLYPTVEVYGSDNISLTMEFQLASARRDLTGEETPPIPKNYHPAKGAPHPVFDYSSNREFCESGRLIK